MKPHDIRGSRPACTPEPAVRKLHHTIVKILQRPDVRERVARMGGVSIPMTEQQFTDFVNGEIKRWTEVVRKGNIQVE